MRSMLLRLTCALALSTGLAPGAQAADGDKDLVCDKVVPGSHWDSKKDGCYVCPKGFDYTPQPGYSFGRCTKREEREGEYQLRKDRKQPGPVCTEGAWVSLHDLKNWPAGVCMKCPKPPADVYRGDERIRWAAGDGSYQQDPTKKGTQDGVCWRDLYAAPELVATGVVGGQVMKICEATLTVFAPGRKFPSPLKMASNAMPKGVTKDELYGAVKKFQEKLSKKDRAVIDKVAALAKVYTDDVRKELFSRTEGLCEPGTALTKLKQLGLVPKDWSNKNYVAFSTTFDAGLGAGALGGYMLVTNFDRVATMVGMLGAQIGVKGGVGLTGGIQFFPSVDEFDEFLGGGLGASVGVDVFVLGVGVDASFTFNKKGQVALQGIGPNLSIGPSGTPASVSVSGTYGWDMSKVKNY